MIESRTCLLPMITEQSNRLLGLYKHYNNGILMRGGGVMDQPNFYLEAMNVIDRAVSAE